MSKLKKDIELLEHLLQFKRKEYAEHEAEMNKLKKFLCRMNRNWKDWNQKNSILPPWDNNDQEGNKMEINPVAQVAASAEWPLERRSHSAEEQPSDSGTWYVAAI